MAREVKGAEKEDDEDEDPAKPPQEAQNEQNEEGTGEDGSEEDEENEEPRLKYASLTKELRPVYKNGDATSAFIVAGDKMIIGTHNGNIHVLSVPSLETVRVYHAHSASISSVSMSPFPPPLVSTKSAASKQNAVDRARSPARKDSPSSKKAQQIAVPLTPSNMIYIATSSIDGNVCVQSLTDPKDVLLRNFGRPVQAVALSPDYKSDRAYLSGGRAGNLVLTVGGRAGMSSTSSTAGGAVASAAGWLGSVGISSASGKDQVLHSGEGAISTIKWSLSGDYVVWVNEQGIKIMRSNLHLDSGDSEMAWKRISHTDHPNRPGWDEMAGIWKAHVEWIDETGLEFEDTVASDGPTKSESFSSKIRPLSKSGTRIEKLVVGWSGTIWIINVHRGDQNANKHSHEKKIGRAEVVTILRLDCIISGISLYTPNLLLVLAYVTPEEEASSNQTTKKPGVHRRKNALQPEMRIIDVTTKEEVSVADQLTVSRYETLSATDYHLGVLPAIRIVQQQPAQRGALEAIGGGIEAIGGGLWDATLYPARMFTSAASVRSGSPGSSRAPSDINTQTSMKSSNQHDPNLASQLAHGMKIFIHSPYDCISATKPTLADHFSWLDTHSSYEEAWELLNSHPDLFETRAEERLASPNGSISKGQGSLLDFFEDDATQLSTSGSKTSKSLVEREKQRIGEKWIEQLVGSGDWSKAGQVCGKVLHVSASWERWVWEFAHASKYDELTPFIPTSQLRPPLPSIVYELMLGHYISEDPSRFRELLERWPPELYSAQTVIEAVQSKIRSLEVEKDFTDDETLSRDWRFLNAGLAKLFLAVGRPRDALGCYVRLQDADAAMDLISSFHLVNAVSDNIPDFVLLRVSRDAQHSAPLTDLAALTLEPIRLLVSEAHHGNVLPDSVIPQLEDQFGMPNPYLFFYFRALWNGDSAPSSESPTTKRQIVSRFQAAEERLLVQEGKALVSDYADTAVVLFAEYDRELLMQFLKSSATYNLSQASQICAERDYVPELVYLLSKEGRMAEALRLIIDSLDDVSQAISFAKEQNDASLWDDLLDYAMNKPRFIRGLLEEVGTSIDPLKLVRRIPLGLEIEGLRDGLARMLKEYEVQESISGGVARVLRGEVHQALQERSQGLRKGIRLEVSHKEGKAAKKGKGKPLAIGEEEKDHQAQDPDFAQGHKQQHPPPHYHLLSSSSNATTTNVTPGHCAACGDALNQRSSHAAFILAFPCTHTFHVSCLLRFNRPPDYEPPLHLSLFEVPSEAEEEEELTLAGAWDRSVGPKVDHAALLRDVIRELGGCPLEVDRVGAG